ncbi:Ig-like domain-containing protein, partial [Vibrio parahaemolyticus]
MSIKRNGPVLVILTGVLAACGGEEQTPETEFPTPEQPATLSLKDASLAYLPSAERHEVNLSPYVTTSDNSPFKLTRVEALSSDAACQVVGQTDTQFYVAGDSKKACDYRYFAESVNGKSVFSQSLSNTSNSALVRLATTETSDDAQLPPLTHATLKNTPVRVDLRAQFDAIGVDISDWVLSEAVTLPYNHDALVDVDVANQTLTYTPESDFTGIDRILFSFTDAEQNPRLGQVDIAVSVEANQGLIVEEGIIYPATVTVGTQVEVDISPYVTSPDGDDYQLVYLEAFDSSLSPVEPDNIYNKKFYFSSDEMGPKYVMFAVSDHKGSYTGGLMQIDMVPNKPWKDIIHEGVRYIAPITGEEADFNNIAHEGAATDPDGFNPPVKLATMNESQLVSYCSSMGATVATYDEWLSLKNGTDIKTEHNWPVKYHYAALRDGDFHLVWYQWSGTKPMLPTDTTRPLCVQSNQIVFVPQSSDLEGVANGVDTATVAVQLAYGGSLIEGEVITASVNQDSSAYLVSDSVTTDSQGMAFFEIMNLKAETLTFTAEYDGKSVNEEVQFIGDVNTAEISLETTVNEQPFSTFNEVRAILKDVNNNPLVGHTLDFFAESHANSLELTSEPKTNMNGEQKSTIRWIDSTNTSEDTEVIITAEFQNKSLSTHVTFTDFGMCGDKLNDT